MMWVMSLICCESCHTYVFIQMGSSSWRPHPTSRMTSTSLMSMPQMTIRSHRWMRHVTQMNESCHTYEWVMSHIWASGMTSTSLMSMPQMTIRTAMCHLWMSHVTHLRMSHVTRTSELYHLNIVHVNASDDVNVICVPHLNEACYAYEWVMSQVWMSHVTHLNASCHTYK